MSKGLTVKAVENARAGATRSEIWDSATRGLYLVVQPSGARSWAFRYRSPVKRDKRNKTLGKKSKLTLGQWPALQLAAARLAAGEAARIVASGRDPAIERKTARSAALSAVDTVDVMLDDFLARYVNVGTGKRQGPLRTAGELTRMIDRTIRPAWGDRKIGAISKSDVIALVDKIKDADKPIAANRTLALVRKFFAWCVARDVLSVSPAAGVAAPGEEKKRQHILSDAELRAVWLATANPLDPFATLVRLLILTGQRRGEVAGIRRTELRLDGAEPLWTIPTSRTKNGTREGAQPHAVPLAPHLVALLAAAPEFAGCDYILSRDGEVPISGFSKSKRTLDKAIGEVVREWRLHDLRRTAASGMQRLGVAVPVIERALNHTSGTFRGIVGTYQVDLLAPDVRAALNMWAAHVEALATA